MAGPNESTTGDDKRALRRSMRELRTQLTDRPERSERITEHLVSLDEVAAAKRLLAYDAVPGEVLTLDLVTWCRSHGIEVKMPEDHDLEPGWPDVIVVPGTAFTAAGDRVGQGGGWYDRFLPRRRGDCITIGIGFDVQLVDVVPTEPHDVRLDIVVTDRAIHRAT